MERDSAFLKHILEAVETIESYIRNMKRTDFLAEPNKIVRDAVVREFEIIGEATRRLSEEIKKKYQDLPWQDISDMRNKLIHEYFGVDMAVVWKTIETDLPKLKKIVGQILNSKE